MTKDKPQGPARTVPEQVSWAYFPLDQHLLAGVDALLHVRVGRPATR
jgi:hypothetical protein